MCMCACSTNMAIGDAGKLGSAITKHKGDLDAALQDYQEERMAQTAKEVCATSPSCNCYIFLVVHVRQLSRFYRPGLPLPAACFCPSAFSCLFNILISFSVDFLFVCILLYSSSHITHSHLRKAYLL